MERGRDRQRQRKGRRKLQRRRSFLFRVAIALRKNAAGFVWREEAPQWMRASTYRADRSPLRPPRQAPIGPKAAPKPSKWGSKYPNTYSAGPDIVNRTFFGAFGAPGPQSCSFFGFVLFFCSGEKYPTQKGPTFEPQANCPKRTEAGGCHGRGAAPALRAGGFEGGYA